MVTDDIVTRLREVRRPTEMPAQPSALCMEAADEIERLRKELKIRTAERDHHQKWSKNYEAEIYKLRDQIKKKNSN